MCECRLVDTHTSVCHSRAKRKGEKKRTAQQQRYECRFRHRIYAQVFHFKRSCLPANSTSTLRRAEQRQRQREGDHLANKLFNERVSFYFTSRTLNFSIICFVARSVYIFRSFFFIIIIILCLRVQHCSLFSARQSYAESALYSIHIDITTQLQHKQKQKHTGAMSNRCIVHTYALHSIFQCAEFFSYSLFISDTTMVYFHTFCQIDFRFVPFVAAVSYIFASARTTSLGFVFIFVHWERLLNIERVNAMWQWVSLFEQTDRLFRIRPGGLLLTEYLASAQEPF